MQRRGEFIQKVIKGCGAPATAVDILARWEAPVLGQIVLKAGHPQQGQVELLNTHLAIVGDDGSVLYSLSIASIQSIQRKKEVSFPKKTFAETPTFRSFTHFETVSDSIILAIEGFSGVSLSYAVELVWKLSMGHLNPRDEGLCRGYHLGDAIHALSHLPLDVECNLAQQLKPGEVRSVDRPVVLRIETDFTCSIIFRPSEIIDSLQLKAISMPFDNVALLSTKNENIRICCEDERIFEFTNVLEGQGILKVLDSVYYANAATMVYRTLGSKKEITTFNYAEVAKLFQHYCVVDVDLDGCISQTEFLISLGQILTAEKGLSNALYDLFDCFASGRIRFFEYLHGNRVLLRGDVDDRLRYLFGLFDTKRSSIISSQQFEDGMRIISAHTPLKIPKNETIEAFAYRLFEAIDDNHNNEVDYDEFVRALTGNFGVMEAIHDTTDNKNATTTYGGFWGDTQESQRFRKIMSFGHPQWQQITQILRGIELAITHTTESAATVDASAFAEKVSFNLVAGTVVGQEGAAGGATSPRGFFGGKNVDVQFNDHAPKAFQLLRARFGIGRADYLKSLGLDQLKRSLLFGALTSLYEMSSSGRSGSFFYQSHDQKYILKTIPKVEADTLRRILQSYYTHMTSHPDTLVTRFCALYSLSKGGNKIYFVVMTNVHMAKLPIRDTFDLKGSTHNRSTPMAQRGPGVALKDNDFTRKELRINHATRGNLIKQLQADSLFLSKNNLNDYSFLLGIHTSTQVLEPSDPQMSPKPEYSSFQQFYGGIPNAQGSEVYYMGIIDILTDYNFKKAGEHVAKSALYDGKQVSCVPPIEYQERYMRYCEGLFVGV